MALVAGVGMTPEDLLNALCNDNVTAMSYMEFLRWALGGFGRLSEHFEAFTLADLMIPYTENIIGGGASAVYLDNEPSAIELSSGAVLNDGIQLMSDRTFSLAGLGGTTLVMEARLRINNEANLRWGMGMRNATTNLDLVSIDMDTGAAPPRPNGTIQSYVNGAAFYTDLGLAAAYDLTLYHVYRLEFVPGTRIDAYVDGQLVGSEVVAVEVCDDQTFIADFALFARAGANRQMFLDYYRVWSE